MSEVERAAQTSPAVSIVLATFNRPEVLAFAIRSVLAQDLQDWELIVVGDHCTESTAAAVAAFRDLRISYINLPVNFGDQSGPNNVGIARARGRYIAFLNHDDLWFPDHLSATVGWLEACGADMVIARAATVSPAPEGAPEQAQWSVRVIGAGRSGRYDPASTQSSATCVVIRTAAARAVDPWISLSQCRWTSSQHWSYCVWRHGFEIRPVPHLTVVKLNSALRPGVYTRTDTTEHAYFEAMLKDPQSLRLLLLDRDVTEAARTGWRKLRWSVFLTVLRLLARFGIPPFEVMGAVLLRRRPGEGMRLLYDLRGLPPPSSHDPDAAELRARYAKEKPTERVSRPGAA